MHVIGYEEVRFREEVVFHRMEIRGHATNIAVVNEEKGRGTVKTPVVII